MSQPSSVAPGRRINWRHVNTVLSVAVLIAAEVFGVAYAAGWAIATLLGFDETGSLILRALFFILGIVVMISFVRHAQQVEPFMTRK
jgi:hypothetical protein